MNSLSPDDLKDWARTLSTFSAEDVVRWALQIANGRAVISTNFRPYEAVLLHLVTRQQPDIPVLWVDHGYNRPATYRHADDLRRRLKLNLQAYTPAMTVAHREALHGPPPRPDEELALRAFSETMKIEPFRRGMKALAPTVWFTSLRRAQSADRKALPLVGWDETFGVVKVNPLLTWDDARLESYLRLHHLPNERDYFDPAKADEKRECGLHATWARETKGAA